MNSNEERLAEIRARLGAATEGPWAVAGRSWEIVQPAEDDPDRFDIMDLPIANAQERRSDAEFIAHARTDIPWLLDLVAQHEATIYQLESVLTEVTNLVDPIQVRGDLKSGWNMLRKEIRHTLGINDG